MFKKKLLHENSVFLQEFALASAIFTSVTRCSVLGSCKREASLKHFVTTPEFVTLTSPCTQLSSNDLLSQPLLGRLLVREQVLWVCFVIHPSFDCLALLGENCVQLCCSVAFNSGRLWRLQSFVCTRCMDLFLVWFKDRTNRFYRDKSMVCLRL